MVDSLATVGTDEADGAVSASDGEKVAWMGVRKDSNGQVVNRRSKTGG